MKNGKRDGIWMTLHNLPMRDRELAVLRALGRLGPTRMQDLAQLLLVGLGRTAVYDLMVRLRDTGLVWETRGPSEVRQRVFGLTAVGRDHLAALGAEPDDVTLERLLVREPHTLPPSALLWAEVVRSAWCASVLDQARRVPTLVGVRCQTMFVPGLDTATGQPLQTMGAYVELCFSKQQQPQERRPWQVPWQDEPEPMGSQVVRWGLEVDTGVQMLAWFSQQAQTYAALQPLYTTVLGGPVTPILLTPSAQRSTRVMQAWREGWPETTALCASVEQAEHPTLGVLWGTYLTVKDDPPQPTYLLRGLVDDPRQDEP